jgi:hypothetical protein
VHGAILVFLLLKERIMKTQRELRLKVFHARHIENVAFRHALTKGLDLLGESLSLISLSRNVASVNQRILSVHSVKYTESSYQLLVGARAMMRKYSD